MVEDRVIFHGFAGGADGFFAPACAIKKDDYSGGQTYTICPQN